MTDSGTVMECALCGAKAKLKQSHIIPRFVSRALEVPDGPTRPLLCGGCEDLFSEYESRFARDTFHPLLADSGLAVKYEKWLLKFCTSVCWRILEESLAINPPSADACWAAERATCRETWRRFLAGKRPDVGEHAIHLLPAARDAGFESFASEVAVTDREAFVYAGLGPVILFGLIASTDSTLWRGTRVHLEGKIKPREIVIPIRYRDYIFSRASRGA